MSLNEADTRAKLIDPAIHTLGWTEDHIKREVSAGSIEIIEGKAQRRAKGHQFVEYDFFTGITSSPHPMTEFPSPDELRLRYENGKGFSLDSPVARALLTPYTGGEGARRYYQDAAIRAVLEKIARSERLARDLQPFGCL